MLGREAVRDRGIERLQRLHLAVEPCVGFGPEAIGPAQAGPQILDAEILETVELRGDAVEIALRGKVAREAGARLLVFGLIVAFFRLGPNRATE